MGYVPPSYDELPLPTQEEFDANPEYYERKLREYKKIPYLLRHYGLNKMFSSPPKPSEGESASTEIKEGKWSK